MYVFLRSMSSHEDSTTGRNQEEKETEVVEEVDVVEDSTTGRNQAVSYTHLTLPTIYSV